MNPLRSDHNRIIGNDFILFLDADICCRTEKTTIELLNENELNNQLNKLWLNQSGTLSLPLDNKIS